MKKLLCICVVIFVSLGARAQLVVPPLTAQCATSIDGSVVGTLNPLQVSQNAVVFSPSYTLPAGNYFVQYTWYDAATHTTLTSPESTIQLVATGGITVTPPASGLPATAAGMNVYIGTASEGETLQGSTTGSAVYTQTVPLVAGAAPPSVNNTVCSVIANDAGWPTGTGYVMTLTTPAGNTLPGYPLQVQLLGPGNTINLSNGLPLYNGTVTYPIPVLARPYGNGPQSISGPLSMTNYNLTAVGRLGVGTALPAWGVDTEGTGINGQINAKGGYLVNGSAPPPGTCLGSVDGVANDIQLTCGVTLLTLTGTASDLPFKFVEFSVQLSGGTATVNLTGNAIFPQSPKCWGNDENAANAVSIRATSGSIVIVNGSGTDLIDVVCTPPPGIF